MADFLLELLSEEMPARMQARAADDLRTRIEAGLQAVLRSPPVVNSMVNPRRLAVFAADLPVEVAGSTEERRGPRADAPAGAIAGFARGAGVAADALVARDDPKGRFLYAIIEKPGRAMPDVLADVVEAAMTGFPWPKSMRWGAASASMDSPRWVRPLVGVVALLDGAVVPLTVLGLEAGRETMGHRFLSHAPVRIASARTYAAQLRDAHAIVDAEERAAIVRDGARACAAAAGLVLIEDEGLVAENAGLTEWPVPMLGHFDSAFLELPREVIQLTMRTNQKYFACAGPDGALAAAFVCVANIPGADGGAAIVEGNRRVLAARLSDARFFWEQDRAKPLADYLPALDRIVFHEKLGTMRDKAERVAKLARWLAETGAVPGADPDVAERAGLLAKADLTTAMVGEFPELQGVMGGYYAAASGEVAEVADAVREHYRPVGPSDVVPSAPVSVAVALADKLDTLITFFLVDERPTGSRDPFALRRSGLGAIAIAEHNRVKLKFTSVLSASLNPFFDQSSEFRLENAIGFFRDTLDNMIAKLDALKLARDSGVQAQFPDLRPSLQQIRRISQFIAATRGVTPELLAERMLDLVRFLVDRLKVQQRKAGVRHDLIDAVFALNGEDDIVRLLARVRALQAFIGTDDGANLLAGYKRAANILAIEAKRDGVARFEVAPPAPSAPSGHLPRSAREEELAALLEPVADEASAAIAAEDFTGAMAALARLRAPIDAFFEGVVVNDPVPAIRLARLSLLQRFHDAVQQVADFSKIEG